MAETIGTLGERINSLEKLVDLKDRAHERHFSSIADTIKELDFDLKEVDAKANHPHKLCGKAGEVTVLRGEVTKMKTLKWGVGIAILTPIVLVAMSFAAQKTTVDTLQVNMAKLDTTVDTVRTESRRGSQHLVTQFLAANREMLAELKQEIKKTAMTPIVAVNEWLKENATPDPNGTSLVFFTSNTYTDNTLSVWVNGRKRFPELDNGFTEMGGNSFMFNMPPEVGDTIQVEYGPK